MSLPEAVADGDDLVTIAHLLAAVASAGLDFLARPLDRLPQGISHIATLVAVLEDG